MTAPTEERHADDGGRYRLDERIATGGMGEVWRATDTALDRQVAVKLLKHEYADDPTFRARFESEARHAAALHHSGIAQIYDFGAQAARPFLVMEYVQGQPLHELLRGGEPMDAAAAGDLLAQAGDAVGAAHAAGIVHRDVKPANLIVTPDRRVKITDFGIARAAESVALTQTGQVIGTPQYLSPEQAQGQPATPASDVYALGVVGYEMLTGRRPFVAETPIATALAHLRDPVPDLPDSVPGPLAGVVRQALAKDPAERFADGTAFAAAVRQAAQGASEQADIATQVVAAPPATRVLTGVAPVPVATQTHQDRRDPLAAVRRVPLPLILAAGAFVLILVVAVLANLGGDGSAPTKKASGPASGPTSGTTTKSTQTSSPTASITLVPSDYVGRPLKDVQRDLEQQDLTVDPQQVANPGGHKADTVSAISPTDVSPGDTVTVSYYGPEPAPPAPPGHGHGHKGKGKGHKK